MESGGVPNFGVSDFFIKSSYKSEQNKEMPCYLLTKKGCDMAADVCRALEISNTTDALNRLDDDEKANLKLGLPGGGAGVSAPTENYNSISHSGGYRTAPAAHRGHSGLCDTEAERNHKIRR